jgi:ribosome-associated protein
LTSSSPRRSPARAREEAPGGLRVTRQLTIPFDEIVIRASRSSGPGGQHANVTASRVQASFDVLASRTLSEEQRKRVLARAGPRLVAIAQDGRSQARNRELALERLGERLERALAVPRKRRPTQPTAASRERRLEAKRRRSERKRSRRLPEDA